MAIINCEIKVSSPSYNFFNCVCEETDFNLVLEFKEMNSEVIPIIKISKIEVIIFKCFGFTKSPLFLERFYHKEKFKAIKKSYSLNKSMIYKIYSTVTDFARFLGLSTSNPFSLEI